MRLVCGARPHAKLTSLTGQQYVIIISLSSFHTSICVANTYVVHTMPYRNERNATTTRTHNQQKKEYIYCAICAVSSTVQLVRWFRFSTLCKNTSHVDVVASFAHLPSGYCRFPLHSFLFQFLPNDRARQQLIEFATEMNTTVGKQFIFCSLSYDGVSKLHRSLP